jgi:hypothetical protein
MDYERNRFNVSAKRNTLEEVKWFSDNEIPLWGINENPLQKKLVGLIAISNMLICLLMMLHWCPLKYDATLSGRPFVNWVVVEQMLTLNKII